MFGNDDACPKENTGKIHICLNACVFVRSHLGKQTQSSSTRFSALLQDLNSSDYHVKRTVFKP